VDLGGSALFALPDALAEKANAAKRLTFGIRPEDIALTPSSDSVAAQAVVVLTEPLGAETLVTFKVGDCELVARCAASFSLKPGTGVTLHLSGSRMHLFDTDSGEALR